MADQINSAELYEWKRSPLTKKILEHLREERKYWSDRLEQGATIATPGSEVVETAKAVGVLYGIDKILYIQAVEEPEEERADE